MRIARRALIAVGALLALVAVNLDTSVSTGYGRVHNIGLQSQQQMLLILGCVLFLAGIILFAVEKIKQTPEEDARERAAEEAARAKVKGAVAEWKRRGDERVELLEGRRIGGRRSEAEQLASQTAAAGWWSSRWARVRPRHILVVGTLLIALSVLFPPRTTTSWENWGAKEEKTTYPLIGTSNDPLLVEQLIGQVLVLCLVMIIAVKLVRKHE